MTVIQSLQFLRDCGIQEELEPAPRALWEKNILKISPPEPSHRVSAVTTHNQRIKDTPAPGLGSMKQELPQLESIKSADQSEPIRQLVSTRSRNPLQTQEAILKTAEKLALEADNLEQLRKNLDQFEGCPLKKMATNTVFSDGNPRARVMLIGEAPGADEDRLGKPFVGLSGQLLDLIFQSQGFTRDNLYISNVIPWRPPGNRVPTREETAMCLPFIERHIELAEPDLVVFVGGTAAKTLMRTNIGISKMRGKTIDYPLFGDAAKTFKATALFHPAYLLRSPGQKKLVWLDLLRMRDLLESLRTPRL